MYLDEMREAIELWATHLALLLAQSDALIRAA
jgi:hypothetical protein